MAHNSGKTRPLDAIRVVITPDQMSATVAIDPLLAPNGVEMEQVVAALDAAGIRHDEKILRTLTGSDGRVTVAKPVTIAHGKRVVPGVAPTLKLETTLASLPPLPPAGPVPTVETDSLIGRVIDGRPGSDGQDVTGRRLPAGMPKPDFHLREGIIQESDGALRATRTGRLILAVDGGLSIVPLKDFEHDVTAQLSLASELGDVRIYGNLRDGASLRLSGSLYVTGSAEALWVEAGEDLTAAGGLLGTVLEEGIERGKYFAGRDVKSRFILGARIEAGRDVITTADALNARIYCGGRLQVAERIHGCIVHATGGVTCRTVSNSSTQETILEIGQDPVLRKMAASTLDGIEGSLERVSSGKQAIKPLLSRRESLTPAQRAHAAQLIKDTAQLEREIHERTAALRARWERVQKQAVMQLDVEDVLSPGVTIRFPHLEGVVPMTIRGPVRITPVRVPGEEPKLAVTDRKTNTTTHLPARYVGDPVSIQLHRVMTRIAA